ncbi:MAG: hypothetical protein U0X20_17135 [Caldilineaceae bacterium]
MKKAKTRSSSAYGMTLALRERLARRMHLTVDELEERIMYHELTQLDAQDTTLWGLCGDLDPLDPYIRPRELQAIQEYLEEAIYQTDDPGIKQGAIWQYCALSFMFNQHIEPYNNLLEKLEGNPWCKTIDGDPRAFACYKRHYTYDPTRRRRNNLFVGPGKKLVLIIPDAENPSEAAAVFCWRLERYRDDPQYGANCSLFHHKPERTGMKGSDLIRAAEDWAKLAWPFLPRFFTHVNPFKINGYHDRKSSEMIFGRAFHLAGWHEIGFTGSGLITLAKDFIPLGAQWPWHPNRRKDSRPPYWPLEKQIDSLPPWAGGTPQYIPKRDGKIVARAMAASYNSVTFYGSEPEPEPM